MASEQLKRRYIGAGIIILSSLSMLIFRLYKHQLPESLAYLPLVVSFLICTTGLYLAFYVSSKDKKLVLLLLPATLLLLAILTFLWERL